MFFAKQITSLEKVREYDSLNMEETTRHTMLRGERFSYQISMRTDTPTIGYISIDSPLKDYIRIYTR